MQDNERTSTAAAEDFMSSGADIPTESTQQHANGYDYGTADVAHEEGEPIAEITDISELSLQTEELPEAADPEEMADRMSYAPHLEPGKAINAIFALAEPDERLKIKGPWEVREMSGKRVANFNYQLTEVREDGSTGKVIKFLQANMFRSGKMKSSKCDDLLFALGKLKEFNQTSRQPEDALRLLQEATAEQRVVRGVIQWRRYDSTTGETWSTAPQKPYTKKDGTVVQEKPWPKGKDGKFLSRVEGWEPNYGNETVSRVMPTPETLDSYKQAA